MEILLAIIKGVFFIAAVLMVFLILLQEGKGGGLAALGGTRAAGVEGVTNPIRRATVYMAAIFFVLAIFIGRLGKPPKPVGVLPPSSAAGVGAAPEPASKGESVTKGYGDARSEEKNAPASETAGTAGKTKDAPQPKGADAPAKSDAGHAEGMPPATRKADEQSGPASGSGGGAVPADGGGTGSGPQPEGDKPAAGGDKPTP